MLPPSAPSSETTFFQVEDEPDSPPSYHEAINMKPISHHNTFVQNSTNYGACPIPDPPPYSPCPSQIGKVTQSGMPFNSASPNVLPVATSVRKKYAAYGFCVFFLIIVMIAAYLGKQSGKHNYHNRHNYDWNF
ncbi:hypothetical protein PPYR_00904 [Photinus pyralis]|uniref:Transmembrane protein n=1 Tax=Photinus pyralis TaxID=7054 RepID=A0A1Y1MXY3_PHOPY|nr:uncharacterized protein LOC116160461 [Photinus pyralis]KAB0803934.1 hypothetical protein PPYR_00904 [Photinus pyralis]